MAQGGLKTKPPKTSKSSKSSQSRSSRNGVTKKGSRVIAPKKAKLVKQQKMAKKMSAGLTAKTERMLGEKAGHLELLEAGRKRKDGDSKEEKRPKDKG